MLGSLIFSAVAHCFRTFVFGRVRSSPTGYPRSAFPQCSSCGEPFPSETTGAFPGAEGQTTTGRRCHPVDDGDPEPNVPVARCADQCEAGHATPLAPQRVPTFLALEVQANGKTSLAQRPSGSDLEDGRGEPYLGRGTNCQRTEAETGDPGLSPHRPEIPEQRRSPARAGSETALADIRP